MESLPQLDIQEDLDNLDNPLGETDVPDVIQVEDLSIPKEKTFVKRPEDIFQGKPTNGTIRSPIRATTQMVSTQVEVPEEEEDVPVPEVKKPKRKKPISEKQKAHLERMRIKAKEARETKKLMKQTIKERVTAELKAAKPKKKKVPIEESEEITEDFKVKMKIPTEKEEVEIKRKAEETQFLDFMSNMERFQKLQFEHQQKAKVEKNKILIQQRKAVEIENKKKKVIKRKAAAIPEPHPAPEILKPPNNPYFGAFNW